MQQREFMYWLKGYLDRGPESGGMGLRQILDIRQQLGKVVPAAEKTPESLQDEGFIGNVQTKLQEAILFQETPLTPVRTHYDTLHRTLRGELSAIFGEEAAPAQTATPAPAKRAKPARTGTPARTAR